MDMSDSINDDASLDGNLESNQRRPPPGYEAFLKNTSFLLHSFVDMAIKAAHQEKVGDHINSHGTKERSPKKSERTYKQKQTLKDGAAAAAADDDDDNAILRSMESIKPDLINHSGDKSAPTSKTTHHNENLAFDHVWPNGNSKFVLPPDQVREKTPHFGWAFTMFASKKSCQSDVKTRYYYCLGVFKCNKKIAISWLVR